MVEHITFGSLNSSSRGRLKSFCPQILRKIALTSWVYLKNPIWGNWYSWLIIPVECHPFLCLGPLVKDKLSYLIVFDKRNRNSNKGFMLVLLRRTDNWRKYKMLVTHLWLSRSLWSLSSTLNTLVKKVKLLAWEATENTEALDLAQKRIKESNKSLKASQES